MDINSLLRYLENGCPDNPVDLPEKQAVKEAFLRGHLARLGFATLGNFLPSYFVASVCEPTTVFEKRKLWAWDDWGAMCPAPLLPVDHSAIELQLADDGSIFLKPKLEAAKVPKDHHDDFVLVYFGWSSADDFDAFRSIAEAIWHSKAGVAWPSPVIGIGESLYGRSVLNDDLSDISTLVGGLSSTIFSNSHPLFQYFVRLPLRTLIEGAHIRLPDQEIAKVQRQRLDCKLQLNCIPFWNQQIRIAWGDNINYESDVAGKTFVTVRHDTFARPEIRVIACRDLTGKVYIEHNLLGTENLLNGFEVRHPTKDGSGHVTKLVFSADAQIRKNDLRIAYAYASQKPLRTMGEEKQLGGTTFKVVRSGALPSDQQIDWRERLLPSSLILVTRNDIRGSLARLAPIALRTGIQALESEQIRIMTQLRKIPKRMHAEYGMSHVAVPTLVIQLGVECPVNGIFKQHYTSLWEQRIEERCPAGTIIRIEWKDDDVRRR